MFLVCFSVVDHSTLQNVAKKWVPELKHYNKWTPILLIGTKTDLRGDTKVLTKIAKDGKRAVIPEEAEQVAQQINALKYMECSALTRQGLKAVFDEAISIGMFGLKPQPRKRTCVIL